MGQEEGRRKKSSYKETMLKSRGCSRKKKREKHIRESWTGKKEKLQEAHT